ncbi:MAG: class II aldolase/adducin family protein [Myxococcota bacterium]
METIGDGPRVKFSLRYLGRPAEGLAPLAQALCDALRALEEAGACPVLDDGLAAGNAAVCTAHHTLLVSASGRRPGVFDPADVVELVTFDPEGWEAGYRSHDPSVRPTSDAPLHFAALVQAPRRFGWSTRPGAALHGHVLDTRRAARELGLPISEDATLFSTPPDRTALLALLERAPFPEHATVIRRDHGFFTLGENLPSTVRTVTALAERAREAGLLNPLRGCPRER